MREDRTGTGTLGVFGRQLRFDLREGFPLLTTKRVHLKSVIHELLWFLRGDTNTAYLQEHGVRIWDEWADEQGNLGPIYGHQWRNWPHPTKGESKGVDQLQKVVEEIQAHPHSRRLIVSAWNVSDLSRMALPPCHLLFQFYVSGDRRLSCHLYQRSADLFLGVPFNIASYSLLTQMIAQVCGLGLGEFVHTFGDAHIYKNHMTAVETQLQRQPRCLPQMHLNPQVQRLDDFQYSDFELRDYNPYPRIPAPVSI